MRTIKIQSYCLFLSAVLFLIPYADLHAQQRDAGTGADICAFEYESIANLKNPQYGYPSIWDARFGVEGADVELASSIYLGNTVMAAGRVLGEGGKAKETFLIELNRRGRTLVDARLPAKNNDAPVAMAKSGENYVVLSTLSEDAKGGREGQKWVRAAWHKADGSLRWEKTIRESGVDNDAQAIVTAPDGKGVMVVVASASRSDPTNQYATLIRMNSSGDVMWKRSYRTGSANKFRALMPVGTGWLAAGQSEAANGRMDGWIVRLDKDGAIIWQRTYSRGAEASLASIDTVANTAAGTEFFILGGESKPLDGKPKAAWVLVIDGGGNPAWQRYYRRDDFGFVASGVHANKDGRLSVLLNAQAQEGAEEKTHVRLLTLSARGALLRMESYLDGLQTRATAFSQGPNGERILTAVSEVEPFIADEAEEKPVEEKPVEEKPGEEKAGEEKTADVKAAPEEADSYEKGERIEKVETHLSGWVMIGQPPAEYTDPCQERSTQ